jgi:hypothetical protein
MTANAPILAYRDYVTRRDGAADIYRLTLSRREAFFEGLARDPVRSEAPIDREVFLRNAVRRRPEPGLDARMLWLLASAKANQAERFAIELGHLYGRHRLESQEPEGVHVALQEGYHTRILADVCELFDLPVPRRPPPGPAAVLIHFLVFNPFPERWVLPLVGASEMMGCVIFRLLRDRGMALFADEPIVAERIGRLYDEILADEIGHVGLIAARMGPRGRKLAHWLFHHIWRGLASAAPEFGLVLGPERMKLAFAAPFDVEAYASELPEIAFAAAPI